MVQGRWFDWATILQDIKKKPSKHFAHNRLRAGVLLDKKPPVKEVSAWIGLHKAPNSSLYLLSDPHRFRFEADIRTDKEFYRSELQTLEELLDEDFSSARKKGWDITTANSINQLIPTALLSDKKRHSMRIRITPQQEFWYQEELTMRGAQFVELIAGITRGMFRATHSWFDGELYVFSDNSPRQFSDRLYAVNINGYLPSVELSANLSPSRAKQAHPTVESLNHALRFGERKPPAPIPSQKKPIKPQQRKPLEINRDEVIAYLQREVIGQDQAIKSLSTAAYLHLMGTGESSHTQRNVLLHGPTGHGKTHLVRSLANCINTPLYAADASSFTAAGYVGTKPKEVVEGLLRAARGDVNRAQQGIIYLDEIDKLASSKYSGAVGTREAQYNLLAFIEGTQIAVKDQYVDTGNVLFIAGGAFAGSSSEGLPSLQDIIARRTGAATSSIGFGDTPSVRAVSEVLYAKPEDFHEYGLIPELVGRFALRAPIRELGVDDFMQIMTKPANSFVSELTNLCSEYGTELIISPEACLYVAKLAHEDKTGARAITTYQSIIETGLFDELGKQDKVVLDTNRVQQYIASSHGLRS